jgi:alkanesulfonate monooxygenase SsuD/methylene tetrahydromethanopterin reductase-like flavin-dependent oxidoreductase (luciferase family)
MALLKALWTQEIVEFHGRWDTVSGAGLNPLPIQRPIPMWVGGRGSPADSVINRIGAQADGWFVLCSPEEFPEVSGKIALAAQAAGRNPTEIGTEAGVALVGPREAEWQDRVVGWQTMGLTHLCLRTLGGNLNSQQHLDKLSEVVEHIPRAD